MKLNLRITSHTQLGDFITWELWGYGMSITRLNDYKLVENAVKAAKRAAKELGVDIKSASYYEPFRVIKTRNKREVKPNALS